MDRFENDALPDLALDNNVLDFGDIKFMQPVTRHVELENQGYVVAKFQFIPKMDEPDFSKSWCDVTPSDGILLPGRNNSGRVRRGD